MHLIDVALSHHFDLTKADALADHRPASSERFATMRDTSDVERGVLETRFSDHGIDVKTGSFRRLGRTSYHAISAVSGSSDS